MASPPVDTRKLKDQVAQFLGKSRFDKALELLEQLVRFEPKEMQHRLRLGDTYRRLRIDEKAIASYAHAGRQFAEGGQLLKAVGAFKVILEIDPKNEMAQRELATMNNRRFARPTLESAGLAKRPPASSPPSGQRASSGAALFDRPALATRGFAPIPPPAAPSGELDPERFAPPHHDDEPLELDLGSSSQGVGKGSLSRLASLSSKAKATALPPPLQSPALRAPPTPPKPPVEPIPLPPEPPAPAEAPERRGPPPKIRPAFELGASLPEGARAELPEFGGIQPGSGKLVDALSLDDSSDAELEIEPMRPVTQPIVELLSTGSDGQLEEEVALVPLEEERHGALPAAARERPFLDAHSSEFEALIGTLEAEKKAPPLRVPLKVPLFDDLSQEAFVELVQKLSYKRCTAGEMILREGDPGNSFFVIIEGKVRVFKRSAAGEIPLATLGEGAFFGEMALLSGTPRTANVAAEEPTELLEITDQMLHQIVAKHPSVARSLKNFYRQRLVNNVMAISPLFKNFDPAERRGLVQRFQMKQAANGEALIREGERADGLFVVLHGRVRVSKLNESGVPVLLAQLREGDIFGEMSLLMHAPASATVAAEGTAIALKLPRENFQELILSSPQVLEMMSELTDQRRSATAAVLSGQGPGHDGMSFV